MDAVECIQSLYQWYKPKSLFFIFSYRNAPFFFSPLAEHPCTLLVPAGLCCWCTVLAMGQEQPFVPLGRAQPREGWSPVLFLSGVQHGEKKNTQKTPNLIPSNGSFSPDPIRKLPSISHYRCALAKRSEMMDSFWVCSNLSNANNYYCRPRTDPIGKMHQGSGEHPWVDGENFVFALVSSFTF